MEVTEAMRRNTQKRANDDGEIIVICKKPNCYVFNIVKSEYKPKLDGEIVGTFNPQ
jgi:hypothetical protein